jgi:twinkle protein
MDIRDISQRLARDARSVCAELLPNGKAEGHEWVDDPGAGKIKVHLDGDKSGVWSHFGGDGSGDLLDLYVKVKGGSLGDALDWARARLGIEKPAFVGQQKRDYRRPQSPPQVKKIERSSVMESVDWYLRQERGLKPDTITAFRVREAAHYDGKDKDGNPKKWDGPWILFPFLRQGESGALELINMKWLHLRRRPHATKPGKFKKIILQDTGCEPGLFGWQAASPLARRCIVTEGEIDAMTAHQYLVECGVAGEIAAFSVPAGAGRGDKQQWIELEWDRLERFEDIVICFDGDKEGLNKVALEEIVHRLGTHRVRIMKLPHKDTNSCLVDHGMPAADYLDAFNKAKPMAPDELRNASEYVEGVIEKFYPENDVEPGIALPWRRMNWIRIRRKEVSTWIGLSNHGKTIVLNQVAMHMADKGEGVCIGSFEMPPNDLLERGARQVTLMRRPTREHLRRVHNWYSGRLWIIDRMGAMEATRLLDVMRYARRRFGCTFFIIDSLMRCGIAGDDYNGQKKFAEDLTKFADAEDCHVALVAHSRKLKDASQAPGRLDAAGSGDITNLVQCNFSMWRNEKKEMDLAALDEDQTISGSKREEKRADLVNKPDAYLAVDKQRFGTGQIGRIQLWFDRDAVSFKDKIAGDLPSFSTVPRDDGMPL